MWRATSAVLLAAMLGGCGFAGVNPRSAGSAPGQFGHQVAAGESIYSIAQRYGTTPEDLAGRNNLAPPYQLTVGQRLVVPPPSSYVVQPGETMDTIARRYGITPSELARVNGIGAPYNVVPGQQLTIPQGLGQGTAGLANAPAATSGPVQVSELAPPGSAPLQTATDAATLPPAGTTGAPATGAPISLVDPPAQATSGAVSTPPGGAVSSAVNGATPAPAGAASAPAGAGQVTSLQPPDLAAATDAAGSTLPPAPTSGTAAPAQTTAAAPAPAQTTAAVSGSGALPTLSGSGFLRPVTGQTLTRFGEGSPVPNDGVNFAAPRGTPVYAAEAGVVAYVGEDIDTFGNLVLIRHADGWVTAYGHNEAILVGEGDVVTRGQTIARVGTTGSVTVPQLHFELRRGTEPVDPMAYLDG